MTGLGELAGLFGSRITTNLSTSFGSLTIQQWIRLIAVAGAYLLLRPYIIKLGGRAQMRQHEADAKASEEEAAAIAAGQQAKLSPNELRGGAALRSKVAIPADSDSEEEADPNATAASSATDWGKNARRRQRRMVRQLLEVHEQKLADAQADDEDKDIQEFLVD